MRKIALLAAAAGLAVAGSVTKADFVYSITTTPLAVSGTGSTLDGTTLDKVTLTIKSTTGTGLTSSVQGYHVQLASTDAGPKFYIRTSTGVPPALAYDPTVANDKTADFSDLTQFTNDPDNPLNRPGISLSYVRLGTTADRSSFIYATSSPNSAGSYTDYGSVATFSVDGAENPALLVSSTGGKTLAVAVVPHGQEVTFSGTVVSGVVGDTGTPFSIATTPEPTSLAFAGIGAAGILLRRRRA